MKITWDNTGEHYFETGVDHAVVYPVVNGEYSTGVAWNGITSFTESPDGAEPNDMYADNIKYLSIRSAETWGASVGAYTYPDEVATLDGTAEIAPGVRVGQQKRGSFGLSIRTLKGNDTQGTDYGYLLKLCYGLTMSPSEKQHDTVNDSPDAVEFSWELDSIPVQVTGLKPTSIVEIDSTKCNAEKLAAFEQIIYGTDAVYAKFEGATFDADTDYYERSASGAYTKTTDTEPQAGKTYYTQTSAGTDARLPLPDEVAELLGETTGG